MSSNFILSWTRKTEGQYRASGRHFANFMRDAPIASVTKQDADGGACAVPGTLSGEDGTFKRPARFGNKSRCAGQQIFVVARTLRPSAFVPEAAPAE
jgi:hypothetical protein